jgi:hypothetical protein
MNEYWRSVTRGVKTSVKGMFYGMVTFATCGAFGLSIITSGLLGTASVGATHINDWIKYDKKDELNQKIAELERKLR